MRVQIADHVAVLAPLPWVSEVVLQGRTEVGFWLQHQLP